MIYQQCIATTTTTTAKKDFVIFFPSNFCLTILQFYRKKLKEKKRNERSIFCFVMQNSRYTQSLDQTFCCCSSSSSCQKFFLEILESKKEIQGTISPNKYLNFVKCVLLSLFVALRKASRFKKICVFTQFVSKF